MHQNWHFVCFIFCTVNFHQNHIETANNNGVTLCLNVAGELTIKVLNDKGLIAKKFTTTSNDLSTSLSDLGNGNYVVNAFNKGSFITSFRLVKN